MNLKEETIDRLKKVLEGASDEKIEELKDLKKRLGLTN